MWINSLELSNFRGFESLNIDLNRPVTLLIGLNGSGKTSVLRSIAAVSRWISLYNRQGEPELTDKRDFRIGADSGYIKLHIRDTKSNSYFVPTIGYPKKTDSGWDVHDEHSSRGSEWVAISNSKIKLPSVFLLSTKRFLVSADINPNDINNFGQSSLINIEPGYREFVRWFKNREDVENEKRVLTRNLEFEDPQLGAVRNSIESIIPNIKNIHIERDPVIRMNREPRPVMVATKDDKTLRLDQLSDGEQSLIALTGDLVRRISTNLPLGDSPREEEFVLLLDEVEQHLHPALQRKVIPALQKVFPHAQIIATTHSPQVLSSVSKSSVLLLKDKFEVIHINSPTLGRDTNAILREVFGVYERPEETIKEIEYITSLIDENNISDARAKINELAKKLSDDDQDVIKLRTNLLFAETDLNNEDN